MRLKGKSAVVTGAGRDLGIGQAITARLAKEVARVVLHELGRSNVEIAPGHGVGASDELETMAERIRSIGGEAVTLCGDMQIEDDVASLMDFANQKYGGADILVNNAGIIYLFGPLVDMPVEKWDAVLGVNLHGVFLVKKHAARHTIYQGRGGRVLSIASQAAKTGFAFATAYPASKHGVVVLTRAAALRSTEYNITVNTICPNRITTGLGAWQNEFMSKAQGKLVDEYLAEMRARIPLGRTGQVNDIGSVCAFLCCKEANYVTAEAMNVSGGEEYH